MKRICVFLLIVNVISSLMMNCFADETISYTQDGNSVSFEGSIGDKSGVLVNVEVYKPGKTPEDMEMAVDDSDFDINDWLAYNDIFYTSNKGKFKITIDLGNINSSEEYMVYFITKDGLCESKQLNFINFDETKQALKDIRSFVEASTSPNEKEKISVFSKMINNKRFILRMPENNSEGLNEDNVLEAFYYYWKAYPVNPEGQNPVEDNMALYEKAKSLTRFNDGKTTSIFDAEDSLGIKKLEISRLIYEKDGTFKNYMTDKNLEYITSKVAEKKSYDISKLNENLTEGLVLAVLKNSNGVGNITYVLNELSNKFGIDDYKINDESSKKLAGNYQTINEVISKVKSVCEKKSNSLDTNGGGGKVIGKSSSSSSQTIKVSDIPDNTGNNNAETDDIYLDVKPSHWAYKAISNLSDKGIVNGTGDGMFMPENTVKREEFVKMIVKAFAQDCMEADIEFRDVPDNAWYSEFIKKAYAAEFIKGIGDNKFGTGENISRQDMAVMIFNVIKYANVNIKKEQDSIKFLDDIKISDYAKDSVYSLKAIGVINGIDELNYNPTGSATRAEATMIIYKMYVYMMDLFR